MAKNPLLLETRDAFGDQVALVELKKQLILYMEQAPGSTVARKIYDLYMARYGAAVDVYRSTAPGSEPDDWTATSRTRFETVELPALQSGPDWGYVFGSSKPVDARLMMFHGSRPASQPGWASLVRIDFEWDFPAAELAQLAVDVLALVECTWGTAGYGFCVDQGENPLRADNKTYAWAMRYWGADARDLDAMLEHSLRGFGCVSWLTILGTLMRQRDPVATDQAAQVAFAATDVAGHLVIQAEDEPRLIDRNRRETLGNYPAVAGALLPLQLQTGVEFGGDLWDEDITMRYLRRFTHPGDL